MIAYSPICGASDCEEKLKEDTLATPRCIPFDSKVPKTSCVGCNRKAIAYAYYSKSY